MNAFKQTCHALEEKRKQVMRYMRAKQICSDENKNGKEDKCFFLVGSLISIDSSLTIYD